MGPEIGKKVPAFNLPDQDGKVHTLAEFKGKKVLVYFYPRDLTPGCTVEAGCFRDTLNDLKAAGVQVLGVSADSVASHKKFAEIHHLNFPLLSDVDKKAITAYDVWKEKSMYGKKYMGIMRNSFLIDEKGILLKVYEKVQPLTHAQNVLNDVKAL